MQKLGNTLINVMADLSALSTNGTAEIKVNQNLCRPEKFEQLFSHFTRGTILEHLDLDIQSMNSKAICGCGYEEEIQGEHSGYIRCPQCGKFAEVQDRNYQIVSPQPTQTDRRRSIRF